MVGFRWCWVALVVAACGGFPAPTNNSDPLDDAGAGADGDDVDAPELMAGQDAFVYLDGAVIDGAPQGTAPTAGTASLSGTADDTKVLTATANGFNLGMPAGTLHYVWQRCTTSACTSFSPIGTDKTTFTLTRSEGGQYVRVGVYAVNSCPSGCGQTATVYSAVKGPVRRVDLFKGASCSVAGGCTSSACKIMEIRLVGFSSGSYATTCNASNTTNPFLSYTTSIFPSERCCYGFAGKSTWATVSGIKSNTVTNW
ncbi:MAG TPA: hypothetical protein VMZ53_34100 [Kofleriaceae bacterium]|nr:hypothetical protein [Kofleriaceae bacterium]